MKFIIKILLKILGNNVYQIDKIDEAKMRDWLFKSFAEEGFKHYFTMRKKYLMGLLGLGAEGKEQQRLLGRLDELKGLQANITAEYKRRKLENEKAKAI